MLLLKIVQVVRLPPGSMSYIVQIRDLSALKDLDYRVRIGDLSEVWSSLYRISLFAPLKKASFFFFFSDHHFYLPAQLVGGVTLSDLLDKPWSQDLGVVPSPPRYVLSIFIAHRIQHSLCSSIFIECCY